MPDYQGREFKATLQANSKRELDHLLSGLKEYARENELEDFNLLQYRHDPDGGYEATISAHNWNPISWLKEKAGDIKEKVRRKKAPLQDQYDNLKEEYDKEKTRRATAEDTAKKYEFKEKKRSKEEAEQDWARKQGKPYHPPEMTEEEILAKMPEGMRKKYAKRARKVAEEKSKSEFEAWASGISSEEEGPIVKVWRGSYFYDPKTGKTVPEGTPGAEQHPAEHVLVRAPGKVLSPMETRLKTLALQELQAKLEESRKARSPLAKASRAAFTVGQVIAQAGATAVGGTAASLRFGPGATYRGRKALAPSYPVGMYVNQPSESSYNPGPPNRDLYSTPRIMPAAGNPALSSPPGPLPITNTPSHLAGLVVPRGQIGVPRGPRGNLGVPNYPSLAHLKDLTLPRKRNLGVTRMK